MVGQNKYKLPLAKITNANSTPADNAILASVPVVDLRCFCTMFPCGATDAVTNAEAFAGGVVGGATRVPVGAGITTSLPQLTHGPDWPASEASTRVFLKQYGQVKLKAIEEVFSQQECLWKAKQRDHPSRSVLKYSTIERLFAVIRRMAFASQINSR